MLSKADGPNELRTESNPFSAGVGVKVSGKSEYRLRRSPLSGNGGFGKDSSHSIGRLVAAEFTQGYQNATQRNQH